MKSFKLRDLMIQVHPKQQLCELGTTKICALPSGVCENPATCGVTQVCGACTHGVTQVCGRNTIVCEPCSAHHCTAYPTPICFQGGTLLHDEPEQTATNLAAMKAQLKQQLAALEEQEKNVSESLRPQTVEDVDDLQQKLEAAIDELKARRAELQAPGKKGKAGSE